LDRENVVGAYKGLARVELAFRRLKTVDLHLRPIHHWLALGCALRSSCASLPTTSNGTCASTSILFDGYDPTAAARQRISIVAPG
jgi:hypothetical protein